MPFFYQFLPRVVFYSLLLSPALWMVAHSTRYRFNPNLVQQIPLPFEWANLLLLVLFAATPMLLAAYFLQREAIIRYSLCIGFYPILAFSLVSAEGWLAALPGAGCDHLFYFAPAHDLITIQRSMEELKLLADLWFQRVDSGPVPVELVKLWLEQVVVDADGSLDRFRDSLAMLGELGNRLAEELVRAERVALARQRTGTMYLAYSLFTVSYIYTVSVTAGIFFATFAMATIAAFGDVLFAEIGVRAPPLDVTDDRIIFTPGTPESPRPKWERPVPQFKAPVPPAKPALPQDWYFPATLEEAMSQPPRPPKDKDDKNDGGGEG
jgi:hypothetical protein